MKSKETSQSYTLVPLERVYICKPTEQRRKAGNVGSEQTLSQKRGSFSRSIVYLKRPERKSPARPPPVGGYVMPSRFCGLCDHECLQASITILYLWGLSLQSYTCLLHAHDRGAVCCRTASCHLGQGASAASTLKSG